MTKIIINEQKIAEQLRPRLQATFARRSLLHFVKYTFPNYSIQWFHVLICQALDRLYSGEFNKLMLFVPPQHGKSELVSKRFPASCLGRNPDLKIVVSSYSADLATKINRQVQRIIDDPLYKVLYPETRLNSKNSRTDAHANYLRNSDEFEVVNYTGSFKGVGVGGPLTGNPVDIGIIDDPIKDAVEGQSQTDRNRKWEWYNEVFCTRLHNDSKQLLTMTRWHEDDLAGRILAHEPGQWHTISLPYIKETARDEVDKRDFGEALWPAKHSFAKAMQMKANSERTYASLCQQRPAPSEGGIFKRHYWKFWERLPERVDKVILSWDCAFKDTQTSDFVVGMVLAKKGADTYIVDLVRGRWDFVETVKRIKAMHAQYPMASEKLIEEKANGAAVISLLKHEIPGLIPICPRESKEARANAVSAIVEAGNVYLPAYATWRDIALYELSIFPNGANDDIVDALTQALNRLYIGSMPGRMVHMSGAY